MYLEDWSLRRAGRNLSFQYYLSSGAQGRLKTKRENVKLLALESATRGGRLQEVPYSDLTLKLLVIWKTGG